ncbi:MAG: cation transporter [Candidatus Hodarchaeales archaeon]|jgi:Cu+-exporting ATPase
MTIIKPLTKENKVAYLELLGLTSPLEAQTIENMLLNVDGVQRVIINRVEAKARVEYDPTKIVIETLIETVEEMGFGALDLVKSYNKIYEFNFRVVGICMKCQETFVNILKRKDGIINVEVNLDLKRVQVTFNNEKIGTREIKNCFFDFEYLRAI